MINKINILAVIPARGGSKGLPRKNVLPLAGKPLISYTISAAKDCELITDIVVNTDDDEIAAIAGHDGVIIQRRPAEMGSDTAKVDELLLWSLNKFEESKEKSVDIIVLLYPTAPLRPTSSITKTIEEIIVHECDSALSLAEDSSYLWEIQKNGTVAPTNYDPANRAPRQLERWNQWRENKAVYAMKRDLLVNSSCRLGGKIGYCEMSDLHSIDIDSADDLAIAESIIQSGRLSNS